MYSVKDADGNLREYNLARRDLQPIPADTFAVPKPKSHWQKKKEAEEKSISLEALRKPFTKLRRSARSLADQNKELSGSYWQLTGGRRRSRRNRG